MHLNQADNFYLLIKNHNQISRFWACIIIIINFMIFFMNLCKKTLGIFGVEYHTLSTKFNHFQFWLVFGWFFILSWMEKAEPSWKLLSSSPGSRNSARAILFNPLLFARSTEDIDYWIGTYIENILNKFPNFSSPTTTKLLLGTLALLMTTRILTVHGRPSSRCVFTFLVKIAPLKSTAAHCGFKWVKYARNKFTWCDFTSSSK